MSERKTFAEMLAADPSLVCKIQKCPPDPRIETRSFVDMHDWYDWFRDFRPAASNGTTSAKR